MPLAISDAGWSAMTTVFITFCVMVLLVALIIAGYKALTFDLPDELEAVEFDGAYGFTASKQTWDSQEPICRYCLHPEIEHVLEGDIICGHEGCDCEEFNSQGLDPKPRSPHGSSSCIHGISFIDNEGRVLKFKPVSEGGTADA